MIFTAVALLGAAGAAAGGTYVCTKGVKVEEAQIGQPGIGPKWRIRFACWRWKAEVWSARNGWRFVGDYKTPELAKGAAIAAAMEFAPPAVTGVSNRALTSYRRRDV